MIKIKNVIKPMPWFMALLVSVFVVGCGAGSSPILGGGGVGVGVMPTVTAVAPANNATAVPINNTIITAAFSEPMEPIIGVATFAMTCAAPCVNPTGTVALDATKTIASYTSAAVLAPLTTYTATITGAKSLATGLAMASPYVWHFTTGITPDTVKPRVTLTAPLTTVPGPTLAVPTNTAITAVFSEDIAPATLTATSFTLNCASCVTPSPVGMVSYAVGSRTAIFTPTPAGTLLEAGKTYTATLTTAVTDLSGNPLAGVPALPLVANNYVWTFTTAMPLPPASVSVLSINPIAGATGLCPSTTISATFTVPSTLRMDPLSVTSSTFIVTGPAPALTSVAATSVSLDIATGHTATFTPLNPLVAGTYAVKLKGGATGVKDLAIPGNTMVSDFVWNVTTGPATGACAPLVSSNLGVLAPFGIAAAAGVSNTPSVPLSHINGDVVLHPTPNCNAVAVDVFGGFGTCGGMAPTLTGLVISPLYPDAGITSGAIKAKLNAVYLSLMPANMPGATLLGCGVIGSNGALGAGIGCAGNATLPPGVYISATASTIGITGVLTLDGGGNANAQFVFQAPSTLTTAAGAPGLPGSQIVLINGAKASNVWWQVGSSATIGTYADFQGNILADSSIVLGTSATSCGRLLAGAVTASGAFTFDTNVVSVPGNPAAPAGCL
jgi:Ice-binding-like/Bacterial Ig-like domain